MSSNFLILQAFQATNHENLEKFCGQPDCVKGVETMEKEYGSCYGGTLCASMSQNFDYAKCKAAMEDNLPKSFRPARNTPRAQRMVTSTVPSSWRLC